MSKLLVERGRRWVPRFANSKGEVLDGRVSWKYRSSAFHPSPLFLFGLPVMLPLEPPLTLRPAQSQVPLQDPLPG